MSDLISVIVPIYKVEKYLSKCINSILNQSYKNLEIILVNDGSPDRCGEICEYYKKKDKRIKVIHKSNGGLSDARNVGIENALGKYIGFVDSDDFIHKDMYKELYNSIIRTNSDIVICDRIEIYENQDFININEIDTFTEKIMNSKEAIIELNSYKNIDMAAWNKLYKRELFNDIKFPIGVLCEDYYIMYKLFHLSKRITYISKKLYYYLQRNDSISKRIEAYDDFIKASKKQFEFIKINYPEIDYVAKSAIAFAYIGSYNAHLKNNIQCLEIYKYRKEVKNSLVCILKCKTIDIKKKIQAIIFINNLKIYNYCFQLLTNKNIKMEKINV